MQVEETLRKGSAEKNPDEARRAGAEGKRAAQNEARTATAAHTRQAARLTTPLWSRCMGVLASKRGKISLQSTHLRSAESGFKASHQVAQPPSPVAL